MWKAGTVAVRVDIVTGWFPVNARISSSAKGVYTKDNACAAQMRISNPDRASAAHTIASILL
jgi:hypothetical protein